MFTLRLSILKQCHWKSNGHEHYISENMFVLHTFEDDNSVDRFEMLDERISLFIEQ